MREATARMGEPGRAKIAGRDGRMDRDVPSGSLKAPPWMKTRRNFGDDEGVGFGEDEEGVRRCRSKVWRGEVGEYGTSNWEVKKGDDWDIFAVESWSV